MHSIRSCHIHEIHYLSNVSKFSLTDTIGMLDLDYNTIKSCNYAITKKYSLEPQIWRKRHDYLCPLLSICRRNRLFLIHLNDYMKRIFKAYIYSQARPNTHIHKYSGRRYITCLLNGRSKISFKRVECS